MQHAIHLLVRPKGWVVLGIVLAAIGFIMTAFFLLGLSRNFPSWSPLLAVGLLLAAVGLRSLPKVGILLSIGLLVAAVASGLQLVGGLVVNPGDVTLLSSNAALLLGMAVAAGVSWRARRDAAMMPGHLRVLAAGFLLGALGGVGYFVVDGLCCGQFLVGDTLYLIGLRQFLFGDALVIIGLGLAAWKIRAVESSK